MKHKNTCFPFESKGKQGDEALSAQIKRNQTEHAAARLQTTTLQKQTARKLHKKGASFLVSAQDQFDT